jgi:hypothetical protein
VLVIVLIPADEAAAWKVASRLRELREGEFTGGPRMRVLGEA